MDYETGIREENIAGNGMNGKRHTPSEMGRLHATLFDGVMVLLSGG